MSIKQVKQARFNRKLKKKEERLEKFFMSERQETANQLKSEVQTLFVHNINRMHSLYIRWKTSQNSLFIDKFTDMTSIWLHWLHFDIMAYQKMFAGRQLENQKPSKISLRLLKSPEEFWNSFDPYEDIVSIVWRVRYTVPARLFLLKQKTETRMRVMSRVIVYSTGYLNVGFTKNDSNSYLVSLGPCANMVFFAEYIEERLFIVFCTEMVRLPLVSQHSLVCYDLIHHMKIIGFCETKKDVNQVVSNYLNTIKAHPDQYLEEQNSDSGYFKNAQDYFRKVGNLFFPFSDSKIYLSSEEIASFKFDTHLKRWVNSEKVHQKKIDSYFTTHPLIKQLATEEAGNSFVKILTNIPNFRIKLTEQQQEAVSQGGHIVILGRSGTGKTTCAVLRMFAAELLFRFKTSSQVIRRFGPEDVGKSSVLHSAFVTASPVLTNEVKRFYGKLNEHVKAELERKAKQQEANKDQVDLVDLDEVDQVQVEDQFSSSDDEEQAGPASMINMKDSDFPLFFTVRRLIFMVDSSLRRPFFARDIKGRVIGTGSNFEWHNEYKGSLKISREYKNQIRKNHQLSESESSDEEELERSMDTEYLLKRFEDSRKAKAGHKSFEVDFKVFKDKFWPSIKSKTHFSALVVWTEITAYIKGSATSWMYTGYYLPKVTYANKGQKVSLLTREEKMEVWELFILYERWKVQHRAYDFQDIVNYVLCQVKYYGYSGVPIHFMMVDEVQDLTPATIYLLISICKQKLVFSGDTAQTIAKGVGFRFCDIETLFQEAELAKPSINQLSMNFRTHNQVLHMANSVVSLIETLFPQTIDKMARETSLIDGPMPMIIPGKDHNDLFYWLFGISSEQTTSEVQFGCNQVIIVRNQEAKEKLHPLLSHALCLTVFEAKGLEFDDVILFNFFTDSEVSNEKWRILNSIRKVDVDTYYKNTPKYEGMINKVEKLRCLTAVDQGKLSLLCTELKHLYVAVTRPKKNLIIFDEEPEKRRFMQEYWDYMDVVQFLEKKESADVDYKSIAQKTNAEAWRNQGERMMSHKFYDQAAKCFNVSGDKLAEAKALAFAKASTASSQMTNSEALLEEFKFTGMKSKTILELKQKIKSSEQLFTEAAEELLEVYQREKSKSLFKQIAQCFASGKNFLRAAEMYFEIGFLGQAAECYSSCGQYEKAGELFDQKGDYVRAIDCFSLAQNWDRLIRCLHHYKDLIPSDERRKYVYKYMPVALESLLPKVLPGEQPVFIKKLVEEQKNTIKEARESDEDDLED
jgi:tetratricopeptide (TPR) repeat protein